MKSYLGYTNATLSHRFSSYSNQSAIWQRMVDSNENYINIKSNNIQENKLYTITNFKRRPYSMKTTETKITYDSRIGILVDLNFQNPYYIFLI